MITPEEAWSRIERELEALPAESVARRQAAGRVLTERVEATVDLPAHDVSAMDGYVFTEPVEEGATLRVAGVIAAGDPPGFELAPHRAARIMTGAPVPQGAWGVVPVEQTDGGEKRVRIDETPSEGAHIRRRGEVLRSGDPILEPGRRLTPAALSLLASHGHDRVRVHRKPRIATLATGDEVVAPEKEPAPGQLRDSHTDFLVAAGRQLGLEPEPLGIAADTADSLRPMIERGLSSDLLLISGGVSMGAYDLVEPVFRELGCRTLFDAVALQPGKPLVVARHPGGWVVGLPGNPASVMVCFWLFVKPLIRSLQGLEDGFWQGALRGRLASSLPGSGVKTRFFAARVDFRDGVLHVTPAPPRGSHDLAAYSHGRALVRIPAHAREAAAGDPCEVLPLGDWP